VTRPGPRRPRCARARAAGSRADRGRHRVAEPPCHQRARGDPRRRQPTTTCSCSVRTGDSAAPAACWAARRAPRSTTRRHPWHAPRRSTAPSRRRYCWRPTPRPRWTRRSRSRAGSRAGTTRVVLLHARPRQPRHPERARRGDDRALGGHRRRAGHAAARRDTFPPASPRRRTSCPAPDRDGRRATDRNPCARERERADRDDRAVLRARGSPLNTGGQPARNPVTTCGPRGPVTTSA